MERKTIDQILIFGGILVLITLAFLIIRPILFLVVLAFIFGYILRPLFLMLYKRIKVKWISALIIIFLSLALLIIPIVFLAPELVKQTFALYDRVKDAKIGVIISAILPKSVSPDVISIITRQFDLAASTLVSSLVGGFSSFLAGLPEKLIQILIFFTIAYIVLVDFEKISNSIVKFIPLSSELKKKFGKEFRDVTDGVVYGEILIGILQGIIMGLVMFVLGVEGTLFFTIIAIIAGILPMIGMTVVWVPLGLILLINGMVLKAVLLVLGGVAISGVTDYILKPYVLSKRTSLSTGVGFISRVGGFLSFGLMGLVLGPLIFSYLGIVINFYKQQRFEEILAK